jgi:hypothetical protein
MASNSVFHTTNGWEIHLFPIQIEIGLKAYIKCIQMSSLGMYQKDYILENDEYHNWGSDDDYIKNYICGKETYLGRPCNVEEKPNVPINPILQDDRSVHNEADIQRIQTLQEQLDAQALKLKSITDMLIGKGFV